MMKPCKVTFSLDGTGVYWTPHEPIHLDALLQFCCAPHHVKGGEAPDRDEQPMDIPIPCCKWHIDGAWGWRCSALFPEGPQAESTEFWRKRFRANRAALANRSPNLTNGQFRDYNQALPMLLCHTIVAWAMGDRYEIQRELRRGIKSLGKKRAHGHGRVASIDVINVDEDWSVTRDGLAMRYLPKKDGWRSCRVRPPYWNRVGAQHVCEIGEPYDA